MAHFSCFPGASALSDFRQTRLLDTLKQIDANIVAVRGQFLHFVNAAEPLSADDSARIDALMHYGAPFEPATEKGTAETFVVRFRHGLAVGEQGDRHRAALRPHAGAPHRARCRIHGHAEVGPARRQEGAVGRRARSRGGRAA